MNRLLTPPPAAIVDRDVCAALDEDIGSGDLTALLVDGMQRASATVISRENAVLAGAPWFAACLRQLDPTACITWQAEEGSSISIGQTICDITANARALLTAERSALNFLQTLSATASLTQQFVQSVAGTSAKIVDTRKTLPGLRLAQKYAVRAGGGENHRVGLYDGILIKENHIIAAGGIDQALALARSIASSDVFIQIEVENLDELDQALTAGATMILLDNMDLNQLRDAVRLTRGRAVLEASGNVNLQTVRAIAQTGVHRISVGELTKNIRAIDLSLRHLI